jgi:hypothetical protein
MRLIKLEMMGFWLERFHNLNNIRDLSKFKSFQPVSQETSMPRDLSKFKSFQPIESDSNEDSWGKYVARKAKDLTAGAVGGLIDTATSTYNIPAALTNASNELNKDNPLEIDPISGVPIQKSEGERPQLPLIPSATEAIDKKIDSVTNDYTKTPEDEKTSQAALRTVGSVLSPGGLAKGAASLGMKGTSKVLGAIGSTNPTSLAAAGAAGAATHEASERGYGTVAAIGTGLGAGAATGAALGVAKAFNTKIALAKLTGNSPKNINLEALQAAESAGLDYPNTLVNEGRGLAAAEQVVAKSPYFGTKYNRKLSKIDKEYSNKVDEAIKNVGERIVESGDSLDVGSQIKETFQNVKKSIEAEKNLFYEEANALLPEGASITPKHLAEAVEKVRNSMKTLGPSEDQNYVLNYLNKIEPGFILGSGKDKVAVAAPVDMISGTKVSINDIINWQVKASGPKDKLKLIQSAIKEDLKEYGKTNPEWYKKFSEADQFYGKYLGDKALSSDTVKKVLSQENPEKILTNLKDISDFKNLNQALGRDAAGQKFFDSIKREKLTDLIMGKVIDNKTGNVTYLPFAKVIENPQTKQLIKYLAGDNYQEILSLKKYAEAAIKRNQRNPNPSGTGPTNAIIGGFVGAAAESGGIIKKAKNLAYLGVAGAGLSWLVNNKTALKWGIEGAKKQAAGNYKDASVLGKRIERSMAKDLGEDFVKQFVALSS